MTRILQDNDIVQGDAANVSPTLSGCSQFKVCLANSKHTRTAIDCSIPDRGAEVPGILGRKRNEESTLGSKERIGAAQP